VQVNRELAAFTLSDVRASKGHRGGIVLLKPKKNRRSSPRQRPKVDDPGRRDFFKKAMWWVVGAAASGVVGSKADEAINGLVDRQWWRDDHQSVAHKRVDLVERLFFDVHQSTDFMPPSHWQVIPPNVDTGGGVFTYEHEARVLDAMKFFFHDVQWKVAADKNRSVDPSHSQVFIGSGVSNLATREYLGDANAPRFEVRVPGCGCIKLPYGMAYVSERQIERLQYGEQRVGPESAFVDSSIRTLALPQTGRGNQLQEDYLLVTRLPGRTFFTGLHGPGTRATELFFRQDPRVLEDLEERLNLAGGSSAYFQAVFRATELVEVNGSLVATHLECMREPCPPVRLI
jgi:hypothetical protein